jgi:regulator of sigma E protease
MFDFLLGNDTLSAIIAFVLVLIPAIFIHELGHFLAAKAVGITILEFGIGMPPRMIRLFSWKGTDYTLNWLPLGGFVRPLGEDIVRQVGDEATESDRTEAARRGIVNPKSVSEARPAGRIFFMAGGALANFLFAFVLFTLIGLSGIPQVVGARVNILYIDPASPLAASSLAVNDVIETIDGERFDDPAEFAERLLDREGEQVVFGVRRVDAEDVLDLNATTGVIAADAPPATHPLIVGVVEDAPAGKAGILPGDIVTAFDGETIATFEELQALTRQNLGETVTLTVWRAGETQPITLIPRSSPPPGQGAMGIEIGSATIDPRLGIAYQEGLPQRQLVPLSLTDAMQYSLGRIGEVFNAVFSIPGQLLSGTAQPESLRLTSPLGISQIGGVFLQDSIEQNQPTIILEFIALINVALGLTNLLPIPALDGGRILFVLVELVRGRPIAPEREGMVHLVGLAVLLSLMVLVLLNDIRDPITNLIR